MQKPTVVIVDDDVKLLAGLKRMLRPFEDEWEFIFLPSAYKALEVIENQKIDVFITDICMPLVDGNLLLDIIKKKKPEVIRVMMTGKTDSEIYGEGYEASQYSLWKPFNLATIQTLLNLVKEGRIAPATQEDV